MKSGTAVPACPRDNSALNSAEGRPDQSSCGACGGILLRDEAIKTAMEANGMEMAKTRTLFELPAPVTCPGCRTPMKGMVLNGIEIDLCDACKAVWLDKGELEKAKVFLQADLRRKYPKSPSSADDFGIFGGMASEAKDYAWDRQGDAEIIEEITDVLKRIFGR